MNNLIKQAIEHYKRMIKWAKKQPKKENTSRTKMREDLKEDWSNAYCTFCNEYLKGNNCPLQRFNNTGKCYLIDNCCNGLWYKMHVSVTWGDWIKNAKKVMRYIKKNGKDRKLNFYLSFYKKVSPKKFEENKMQYSRKELLVMIEDKEEEIIKRDHWLKGERDAKIKIKNDQFIKENLFKFKVNDLVYCSLVPNAKCAIVRAYYKKEPETNLILDIEYQISCIEDLYKSGREGNNYYMIQDTLTLIEN